MKSKKASALLFVLGLIFAASILLVSLFEYLTFALKLRASSNYEQELRTEAYSALNVVFAILNEYSEIDEELYTYDQGWTEPLKDSRVYFPSGAVITAKVTDESSKISLSSLSQTQLQKIFVGLDYSEVKATELSQCIWDWSDANDTKLTDGAEYDDYNTNSPKPPNRPIMSFDEFRYIEKAKDAFFNDDGTPTAVFEIFKQSISLEHFENTNLNTASPETLKMLLDLDDVDYDDTLYQAIRGETGVIEDGITWVTSSEEILARSTVDIPTQKVTYTAQMLKIEITVSRGIGEYYLCVYATSDINTYRTKTTSVYVEAESGASTKTNLSSSETTTAMTSQQTKEGVEKNYEIIKVYERGNNQ